MSELEQVTIIDVWWGGKHQAVIFADHYEYYLATLREEHPEVTDVRFEARRAYRAKEPETFGHEPVDEYAGTPEGERGVSRIVCARCMTWKRWSDVGLNCGSRVSWPCTSALVLGLVPRNEQ